MNLGSFSVSLAVKDITKSRRFYQTLGFSVVDGDEQENWLILANGHAKIGLFQGMFDHNILTFNPPDVSAIREAATSAGYPIEPAVQPGESAPSHIMVKDPDGNTILFDQR